MEYDMQASQQKQSTENAAKLSASKKRKKENNVNNRKMRKSSHSYVSRPRNFMSLIIITLSIPNCQFSFPFSFVPNNR